MSSPNPRPNPGVSSPIGWPDPRKGGTGAEGETDAGEGGAAQGDPRAERPTLPRMVGIVGTGDQGLRWQWRRRERDWGRGMCAWEGKQVLECCFAFPSRFFLSPANPPLPFKFQSRSSGGTGYPEITCKLLCLPVSRFREGKDLWFPQPFLRDL